MFTHARPSHFAIRGVKLYQWPGQGVSTCWLHLHPGCVQQCLCTVSRNLVCICEVANTDLPPVLQTDVSNRNI